MKWIQINAFGQRELTDEARKQLVQEGYEFARDAICDKTFGTLDEFKNGYAQDASSDMAAYHYDLTAAGVKEGHCVILREIAADYIYEGVCRAVDEEAKK